MPIRPVHAIRPVCVHHGVRTERPIAILRQNAYMHEQITKEYQGRKYLYECMSFGYTQNKKLVTLNHLGSKN